MLDLCKASGEEIFTGYLAFERGCVHVERV